MTKKAMNVGPM